MKYKTLILDFDGTLADTRESIVYTMERVATRFGIKNATEGEIKKRIGLPLKITFEEVFHLNAHEIEKATLLYRKYYNEVAIDKISLFPDVKECLSVLYEKGISLAVASSKGKEALIKILQKQGIFHLFAFVGGEEDVKEKKPAPDIVNLIFRKLQCTSDECLVVGDTVFDIEMGQRAFADTCGVTYGNNTREQLKNQHPNYIVDKFKSIMDII